MMQTLRNIFSARQLHTAAGGNKKQGWGTTKINKCFFGPRQCIFVGPRPEPVGPSCFSGPFFLLAQTDFGTLPCGCPGPGLRKVLAGRPEFPAPHTQVHRRQIIYHMNIEVDLSGRRIIRLTQLVYFRTFTNPAGPRSAPMAIRVNVISLKVVGLCK